MCALLAFAAPQPAFAGDPVVTAIIATAATVPAGETASFQIGITSTDGTTWPAASVSVTVDVLAPDGSIVASSAPAQPGGEIASGQTTFGFADVKLPAQASGAYNARAVVLHNGARAGVSDFVGLAVGTVVAQAPPPGQAAPFSGQIASNEIFAARSAQSGAFAFTGKYAGDRAFDANLGLSTSPGAQRPVATIHTLGSITQIGTFSPSFDPLVFSGAGGTGIGFKRVWADNRSLSLATISGAHATLNPFSLQAVSYAVPFGAGMLAATVGTERVDGDIPFGLASFMRSGTLAGLVFTHPADRNGFSYGWRYGIVSYDDAISGTRRTDRAVEGQIGFPIRRSAWTIDIVRAGPYFPNLSAPGITPDRETESLQGTIPLGAVSLTLGVNGSRDALPGSPSSQKTHVWSENAGFAVPFKNGDQVSINLSNSTQHRQAIESLASASDNTSISYTARRGDTTYAFTVGGANQRDNAGNLQHTVQDTLTVGRTFGRLQLGAGVSFTGNHAAAMSGTSLLQAINTSASWSVGPWSLSSQFNRSNTLPFLGTAPVPTTGINYGIAFKPAKSRTSLSATMTQNHGGFSSSTGSLNVARQF